MNRQCSHCPQNPQHGYITNSSYLIYSSCSHLLATSYFARSGSFWGAPLCVSPVFPTKPWGGRAHHNQELWSQDQEDSAVLTRELLLSISQGADLLPGTCPRPESSPFLVTRQVRSIREYLGWAGANGMQQPPAGTCRLPSLQPHLSFHFALEPLKRGVSQRRHVPVGHNTPVLPGEGQAASLLPRGKMQHTAPTASVLPAASWVC